MKKREWPLTEVACKYDIMINNNDTEFVFCRLKDYIATLTIDLQLKNMEEEDLI